MKKKNKLHVRKGDTVQIISGNHKGKIGTISKILIKTNQVIIQNLNLKIKHVKSNQQEESGKIINFEAPIHSSNVMLYSAQHNIRSRYKISFNNNKKTRILNKTGEII